MKRYSLKQYLTRSLMFRLTFWHSLFATLVLLFLGMVLIRLVDQHFIDQDLSLMNSKIINMQEMFAQIHSEKDLRLLPKMLEKKQMGFQNTVMVISGPNGSILYASHDDPIPVQLAQRGPVPFEDRTEIHWSNETGTFVGIGTRLTTSYPDWQDAYLIIAMNTESHRVFLREFGRMIWRSIIVAMLCMGLFGWLAARRGLRPLRQIIQGASQVTATRLDYRVQVDTLPLELQELAQTLNNMLARLEDSFIRLSDFSSDLAHELRTPISNLMTQTQVSLSKDRTSEEYRDILYSNSEELERLARMVADMLFLAKTDNGLTLVNHDDIELSVEINSLYEFYEALAETKDITFTLQGNGHLQGDRLMLRRALSNLLSNAIAHSYEHTTIAVNIDQPDPAHVRLVITNRGETITQEHLARLFDRFYRMDSSRHRSTDGAGLGLAITRSIVQAHQGKINAESADGITQFIIVLPRQSTKNNASDQSAPDKTLKRL